MSVGGTNDQSDLNPTSSYSSETSPLVSKEILRQLLTFAGTGGEGETAESEARPQKVMGTSDRTNYEIV